jgi:hypothetical protein
VTIYTFPEGKTEKTILSHLGRLVGMDDDEFQHIAVNGKKDLNPKMIAALGPLLGQQAIRALRLEDLDSHQGETPEQIVQSVTDALRRMFEQREADTLPLHLSPHSDHPHIFTLDIPQLEFRLGLHIAAYRWQASFIKSTIDDFVLALALEPATATGLARPLNLESELLVRKITEEIPSLMVKNKSPLFEAKDYVRFYAAVVRAFTSPPVFAKRTLTHAEEKKIREVFAPLLAALEFLRG